MNYRMRDMPATDTPPQNVFKQTLLFLKVFTTFGASTTTKI